MEVLPLIFHFTHVRLKGDILKLLREESVGRSIPFLHIEVLSWGLYNFFVIITTRPMSVCNEKKHLRTSFAIRVILEQNVTPKNRIDQ